MISILLSTTFYIELQYYIPYAYFSHMFTCAIFCQNNDY